MWLQNLTVATIVLLSVLFAAWRLPGAATRLRYTAWLKRRGGEHSPLRRLGQRLEARILRTEGGSACSGCSAAGDHDAPTPSKRQQK
jgi:hypothetical protein